MERMGESEVPQHVKERTLCLTELRVRAACHRDSSLDMEELREASEMAAVVLQEHLRRAKEELSRAGLSVNWVEDL